MVTVTNGQARANPLNQEWLESMAHYERLLGMYAAQLLKIILCSLQAELGVWKEIEGGGGLLAKITALPDPPVQQSSLELVGTDAADALMQWFTDLPISVINQFHPFMRLAVGPPPMGITRLWGL